MVGDTLKKASNMSESGFSEINDLNDAQYVSYFIIQFVTIMATHFKIKDSFASFIFVFCTI